MTAEETPDSHRQQSYERKEARASLWEQKRYHHSGYDDDADANLLRTRLDRLKRPITVEQSQEYIVEASVRDVG